MSEPIFNEQFLLDLLEDEELIKEILTEFIEDISSKVEVMNRDSKSKDFESLIKSSHTLKGSLKQIGAEVAGKVAGEVEDGARKSELLVCEEKVAQFNIIIEQLCEEVKIYLGDESRI